MLNYINSELAKAKIIELPLTEIQPVSGGCINNCFKVSNGRQQFFIKTNKADQFPKMFAKEVQGLEALNQNSDFVIPKVIFQQTHQNQAYLVLEWLEMGEANKDSFFNFGKHLAHLHQHSHTHFGFAGDNYIGSLVQHNNLTETWATFYLEQRLVPQIELALKTWASPKLFKQAEKLALEIEQSFPNCAPSLLHGDLWSGNYMILKNGAIALIDPAVYYGNREMEIAFMQLFGGFDETIFEIYQAHFPLAENFHSRKQIHQLYPLLVHANLFGGHYIDNCKSILNEF